MPREKPFFLKTHLINLKLDNLIQTLDKSVLSRGKERIRQVNKDLATDERKRKYNSMHATSTPTEAELEAFKRTRVNNADPMAQFLSKN